MNDSATYWNFVVSTPLRKSLSCGVTFPFPRDVPECFLIDVSNVVST